MKFLDPLWKIYPFWGNQPGRDRKDKLESDLAHNSYLTELSSLLRLKFVIFIPNGVGHAPYVKIVDGMPPDRVKFYCPLLFHEGSYHALLHKDVIQL